MKLTGQALDEAFARIALLAFDCDGVLTGSELIYDAEGDDQHVFNVRDGHGLLLLKQAGVKLLLLTGRTSRSVQKRAEELRFDYILQGARQKGPMLRKECAQIGLAPEQVAYIGDDINDLGAMKFAGLPIATADAVPEVLEAVKFVTTTIGGRGAAREVAERILKAKGLWNDLVANYADAT